MELLDDAPLFVAATRPALVAGMPIGLAVAFLMAFALIIIFAENPLYELVLAPVWFGARLIVRYDYNAMRIVALWLQSSARSIDAQRWGGASPAPFPIHCPRRPRGIYDAR
jgi:type IV secretion system protein VirB3